MRNEFGGGGIGGFVAGRGYVAGLGCRVVIYGSLAVTGVGDVSVESCI